jgi:arylsulfatase A-like enzyme
MRNVLPLIPKSLVLWLVLLSRSIASDARPNFLFIYTDDQRHDALGCVQKELIQSGKRSSARFPWIESPNLDRLASEGLRFRNAFVVTALCAPSRAAFLTGCYGHINGVIDNHTHFPIESVTHASLMRQAGYKTAYIGKWHMGSQSGKRPGFDFSASFIGQGLYFDCPVEIDGVKTATQGWIDDVSTEFALEFMRQNKNQPFSIVLGYKTCHGPFTPPPRTEGDYPNSLARVVPNLSTPAIYKEDQSSKPIDTDSVATNLGMFRGLKAIDQNVGKLLDQLDRLGLSDNTVVVYSSDNGYYLGEHGLGDKRSAYEESMRVPMLIRYPKEIPAGSTHDAMVLNIDLAPTFLELAGLAIPENMQGKSWKPLWYSKTTSPKWREDFFYSYFREGRFATPTVTALRTDSMKLIKYPGKEAWSELFDLAKDPYETRNLYSDQAYADKRTELERRYQERAKQIGYHVPEYADEKRLKPQDLLPEDPTIKPANAWVLDYSFDGNLNATVSDQSDFKNDGKVVGKLQSADGPQGTVARFDGKSYIEVPMSKVLNPARSPMTIEVTLRASADGVVVARGGQNLGFLIEIENGKPVFAYRGPEGFWRAVGSDPILDKWVTLKATLGKDQQMKVAVDGQQVGQAQAKGFIPRNPNDGLQIGSDSGSPVDKKSPEGFQGEIQRVRIYHGSL